MNQYYLEDVAWERLKDIQREMENRRLLAQDVPTLLSYDGQIWRFIRRRMETKSERDRERGRDCGRPCGVAQYMVTRTPSVADMTSTGTVAAPFAVAATLGLAATAWVIAVRQMSGMDIGVTTTLGTFASFVPLWVSMMAAMMLPGAAPAVFSRTLASGRAGAAALFVGSYLAVWTLVGVVVYALYRPHGTLAAGAVAIAAGVYELTPFKQHFRRWCRRTVRSGFEFGLYCVGSSIGLMLMLVVLGVMNVTWMSVIAVLILAQKLLPANALIDVPVGLSIIGQGILILIAPTSVPGLLPPM
jgi:predicted metal-binding membrane protein